MRPPFNPKTFLTCQQGPRLVGVARDRACRLLDMAITQGRVLLAARLLTRDPSLITEEIGEPGIKMRPAVEKAIDTGMDVLVLFALEHGMSTTGNSVGDLRGLLASAVSKNHPGLVSCALLYHMRLNLMDAEAYPDEQPFFPDTNLRDALNRICDSNEVTRAKAVQIVLMLLDAGVVPKTSDTISDALRPLIKFEPIVVNLLPTLLKYGGDAWATARILGKPIVFYAARAQKLDAVKMLISASADIEEESVDCILKQKCFCPHIADLHALRQKYLDQILKASGDANPDSADSPNLPPENFLGTPQGSRTCGAVRDTLCKLLEMAIQLGQFVTATKILAQDPSLITETLGDTGHNPMPAMSMAVCAGMEALVPFALAQGVAPCTPMHTRTNKNGPALTSMKAPRGLLDATNVMGSPGLASYALLYHADPNQSVGYNLDGSLTLRLRSFFDIALMDSSYRTGGPLPVPQMLVAAKTKISWSKEMRDTIHSLSAVDWRRHEEQYAQVVAAILKHAGSECINMQVDGIPLPIPLIRHAAEMRNAAFVKVLIVAGVNIDPEFLGVDLFTIFKDNDMGEHIPALSELIIRRQTALAQTEDLAPSVTIVTSQGEPGTSKTGKRNLTARDVF